MHEKCFNSPSYPQTFVQFLLFDNLGCLGDVLLSSRGLQPLHGPVRPVTAQIYKAVNKTKRVPPETRTDEMTYLALVSS